MRSLVQIDRLAARLFGLAVRSRERLYRHGVVRPEIVTGIKVISVGNLAVGGSGKTPFAIYLADMLHEWGERVAFVSRGYRGDLESVGGIVSHGEGPLVSVEAAGDEAYLAARRLSGISVRVGANRVDQVRAARDSGATVVVLDDGFQHRRLYRQLDILLAEPAHLSADARLFPEGVLRDYPGTARRADLIGGFAADWPDAEDELPDVAFEVIPSHIEDRHGDRHAVTAIEKRRVHLLSGIARPDRFDATVRSLGAVIVGHDMFKDHHRFTPGEVDAVSKAALKNSADWLLVTEKDWVRILPSSKAALPVMGAVITLLKIVKGEELLKDAIKTVLNGK